MDVDSELVAENHLLLNATTVHMHETVSACVSFMISETYCETRLRGRSNPGRPRLGKSLRAHNKLRFEELEPVSDSEEREDSSLRLKYWLRRTDLFTKFDEGIKTDWEGLYSVTPEALARHQASRCKAGSVIVDGFTGIGGNAIQFALMGHKVTAIDIDARKIEFAKNNAKVYGVEHQIEFVVGDFFDLAPTLKADIVFLSPPWGGPNYADWGAYDIDKLEPKGGCDLFKVARGVAPNIMLFVPRNTVVDQLRMLASQGDGGELRCEVEHSRVKSNPRANGAGLTAYYGEDFAHQNREAWQRQTCAGTDAVCTRTWRSPSPDSKSTPGDSMSSSDSKPRPDLHTSTASSPPSLEKRKTTSFRPGNEFRPHGGASISSTETHGTSPPPSTKRRKAFGSEEGFWAHRGASISSTETQQTSPPSSKTCKTTFGSGKEFWAHKGASSCSIETQGTSPPSPKECRATTSELGSGFEFWAHRGASSSSTETHWTSPPPSTKKGKCRTFGSEKGFWAHRGASTSSTETQRTSPPRPIKSNTTSSVLESGFEYWAHMGASRSSTEPQRTSRPSPIVCKTTSFGPGNEFWASRSASGSSGSTQTQRSSPPPSPKNYKTSLEAESEFWPHRSARTVSNN